MYRMTKNRMSRISNRLAIYAALLLIVASFANAGGSISDPTQVENAVAQTADSPLARMANTTASAKSSNRFRMSLFLVR